MSIDKIAAASFGFFVEELNIEDFLNNVGTKILASEEKDINKALLEDFVFAPGLGNLTDDPKWENLRFYKHYDENNGKQSLVVYDARYNHSNEERYLSLQPVMLSNTLHDTYEGCLNDLEELLGDDFIFELNWLFYVFNY